jgi:hypothetical protein
MPVCSRCGVAFIEGESHACEPATHGWLAAALVILGLVAILWPWLRFFFWPFFGPSD